MKPQLVSWHKSYAEKGLVVLDINNGKIDKKDALAKSVEKAELKFPVLWDKDQVNCKAYGIKGYPSAYLIDVEGKVVWEGNPDSEDKTLEDAIKKELEKVKKAEK
jgi:peroxiredoxin